MSSEKTLTINGRRLAFAPGQSVLEVAARNGIEIPTLCYLKGASPTGTCRICVVEVDGKEDLVASCETAAVPDMVVRTESPRVVKDRRKTIEGFLASGYHNCLVQDLGIDAWTDFQLKALEAKEHQDLCPAYGDCRLQELAVKYQVKATHFDRAKTPFPIENANPFIVRDFSRCILCGRCVQACNEVQVNNVISLRSENGHSKVVTEGDRALKDSNCVFCGECVQACPVGALVPANALFSEPANCEEKKIRTTCSYCGVGCQIYLHVKDGKVVRVSGVEEVGPNFGSLCVKGRFGYDFIDHPDRLKTPLIREGDHFREASWDEALQLVADRLTDIKKESGPDAIGVLTSARITNEENYLAQKLTRGVIGTNNIDHCARL
jgi:predicted molibdopterin-dependent oxidoreductase YjgC